MTLTANLNSARDLLEKVRRDFDSLNKKVTADKFFNFTITAYSLIDWVKNDPNVPASTITAVESLRSNQWVKICGDIANASKHFKLLKRKPITRKVKHKPHGYYGGGRLGAGHFGVGEESIQVELSDGQTFACYEIGQRVIQTWESFFQQHNI